MSGHSARSDAPSFPLSCSPLLSQHSFLLLIQLRSSQADWGVETGRKANMSERGSWTVEVRADLGLTSPLS